MNTAVEITEFRLKLYPEDFYLAKKFYKEELGLSIVQEWDRKESKGVMFIAGSAILELLWPISIEYDAKKGADVSWEVSDVRSLYEDMKDQPYLTRGLKDNDWGDTSFHIADPDGFRITFYTKNA